MPLYLFLVFIAEGIDFERLNNLFKVMKLENSEIVLGIINAEIWLAFPLLC